MLDNDIFHKPAFRYKPKAYRDKQNIQKMDFK
jgi:hypothetical protein